MVLTREQKRELDKEIIGKARRDARKQTAKMVKRKADKVFSRPTKTAGKAFNKITKAYSYKPSLSKNLTRQFSGVFGGSNSNSTSKDNPVGRPRGDFKHRSPFNGQPIPATVFYKQMREFRRQQVQRANVVDQQAVQELAKRGIPPSQAQQIVDTRQLQSVGVQPQVPQQVIENQMRQRFIQQFQRPNQNQMQSVSNAVRPIWRRQNMVRVERDAFGNVKQINSGNDPRNFWN
jgi:hypothetical protein